jgi:hypothetical protein
MDFLKNAIEAEKSQKRKALETVNKEKGSAKKYISRAELERQREEEYNREQAAFLEQERLVRRRRTYSQYQQTTHYLFFVTVEKGKATGTRGKTTHTHKRLDHSLTLLFFIFYFYVCHRYKQRRK